VAQFEAECGVKVTEANYDSDEVLLAALETSSSDYDVVVHPHAMTRILIDGGKLLELDYGVIPNIENMDAFNINQYFDPEQKFTVPYLWGTTGLLVDANVVTNPEDSWGMLFDPAKSKCGMINMLDNERETIGAALKYLGYSMNDTDPAHLADASTLLREQSPCVNAYWVDSISNADLLLEGNIVFAHVRSYDGMRATLPDRGGRDGIRYFIPREGAAIWQDNMAIPADAPNPYTAMVFMNYLQFPEIAAMNAVWVGFATPNAAAKAFIDPDILANEAIYPSPEVQARLEWIEDVGAAIELYDMVWKELSGSQ